MHDAVTLMLIVSRNLDTHAADMQMTSECILTADLQIAPTPHNLFMQVTPDRLTVTD